MISVRDYQEEAIKRMHNGCILNGGVGTGKSRTSLAYYYILNGGKIVYYKLNAQTHQYDDGPYAHNSNIKLPTSSKISFKMSNPCDLYIITTARKRDTLEWNDELAPFLLSPNPDTNYYKNKVVIDSWNNLKKYVDVKNAFFIFDEQKVVGYGAWAKEFLKITKYNKWILLSATPGDRWIDYAIVFIANGFYRNISDFRRQHVVYSTYTNYPSIQKYINTGILIKYRNDTLISMECEKTTIEHHEDIISKYNEEKYDMVSKKHWNIFDNKPIENANEYCSCLRKIVNTDISRQLNILKIVEDHPKAIIFYNFDYELDILRKLFDNYTCAEWNSHKHELIPETNSWVYFVQYNACEAWNCITTDTMIFYSQNYSYRTMKQASGRINRLNTPFRDLYYYHMRSDADIDKKIKLAVSKKKKFNESKYVGFDFTGTKKSSDNGHTYIQGSLFDMDNVPTSTDDSSKKYLDITDYCTEYNSWDKPIPIDDD